MATLNYTQIADIVYSDPFAAYMHKAFLERSWLFKSGICAQDPTIDAVCTQAGAGGLTVQLPFFKDLSGDSEPLVDGTSLSVDKVSAGKDIAVITRRGKAFGVGDLSVNVAGTDPMLAVANQLADYWNAENQKKLIATLEGVFAANKGSDSGDLILDISGATGDAAYLTRDTLMLAAQLLGDRKTELTAIAMHSAAETALSSIDAASSLYRPSDNPAVLPKYNGRDIIVDDNVGYNASTKVATIYLFGKGAVAWNEVPQVNPYEVARDELMSRTHVITRHASITHVRGYAWKGTATNPTNAQLQTAGNWTRVYNQKEIRVVKLLCKLA